MPAARNMAAVIERGERQRMEDNRKNILEVKNLHTYFFTDSGVVKSVDGVDFELKEGSM